MASVDEEDKPRFFLSNIVSPELPMMIKHMCFTAPYGGRTIAPGQGRFLLAMKKHNEKTFLLSMCHYIVAIILNNTNLVII